MQFALQKKKKLNNISPKYNLDERSNVLGTWGGQEGLPIEKKPLYHFKPGSNAFSIGTYGCNLACDFCQNYEISQSDSPPSVKLSPDEVVAKSQLYGCEGIAYTYSEPVTWIEFVMDASRANDGYNVLVSNGYINEEPLDELLPCIDAANIDVKGGKEFYSSLCHAPYKNTMETVRAMHDSGVHVEVTHLIVPGYNDIAPLCDELVLISPDIPHLIVQPCLHKKKAYDTSISETSGSEVRIRAAPLAGSCL